MRAILLPVSDAAHYSVSLPHNTANVEQTSNGPPPRLLSPTPSDEDEEVKQNEPCIQTQPLSVTPTGAVILRQTAELHCISFGASLENYFVLQSDPASLDEVCYINLVHCQFYSDPDSSDVWLKNSSTSIHSAKQHQLDSQVLKNEPGNSIALHEGTWDLSLGTGLQFICKIHPDQISASLSSTPAEIRRSQKSTTSRDKAAPHKSTTLRSSTTLPKLLTATSPLLDTGSDKKPEGSLVRLVPAEESAVSQILGATKHSRVVMRIKDGRQVAVKVCRRPTIPEAADMWLQEVRMLEALGPHV
jgi:hypothetical protein